VDLAGDPAVVTELVGGGQREAALLFVARDVVRLDRVEPLFGTLFEPRFHDRGELLEVGDVEPALAGPAFVGLADCGFRELAGVGTEVLPAADVDVTDHLRALGVQLRDRRLRSFEGIDVVDASRYGGVDLPL
jgi:hypothetical protein